MKPFLSGLCLLFPSTLVAGDFAVVSVFPPANSLTGSPGGAISVTFNAPMDPASVTDLDFLVCGHWSGVRRGIWEFYEGNQVLQFLPATSLSAGEMVAIVLGRGIRSSTGDSLAHGFAWNYWIATAPGTMALSPAGSVTIRDSSNTHIQSYGAYSGDFNGDGFLDLAIPNELSNDVRVFMNDQRGEYHGFTTFPITGGSVPSPNEGADFNGDGILDYAIGNTQNDKLTIMIGNGTGGFSSVTNYQAAQQVRGVAVLDIDGDGDIDVVTANRQGNSISVLRNNGDGTFATRVNLETGSSTETGVVNADANNDGIMDLYVAGYSSNDITVMIGDGLGGFSPFTRMPVRGSHPWMIATGDINRDGNTDVASVNSSSNTASVLFGDGHGGLDSAATYQVGGFPLAIDLGDIDGDGDLDLVTSNFSTGDWSVLENDGTGRLGNRRTLDASRAGSCATLHDRDNDGDLDMTGIDEIDDLVFLFRNGPPQSAGGATPLPVETSLQQNFPNPFNPTTTIEFRLGTTSFATLTVYDLLGRVVEVLVRGPLQVGAHQVAFNAQGLPSGTYFYRLIADRTTLTRKMVVTR